MTAHLMGLLQLTKRNRPLLRLCNPVSPCNTHVHPAVQMNFYRYGSFLAGSAKDNTDINLISSLLFAILQASFTLLLLCTVLLKNPTKEMGAQSCILLSTLRYWELTAVRRHGSKPGPGS